MPSQPTIDIAALTAPIPGDDPAGGSTPFDVREKLDESRKEIDPASFAADDPTRPAEAKRADWALVIRVASDCLTSKSKDPLVAARLTEALSQRFGFAGLRDGLRLLLALLTDCWERLSPKIDDPSDLDLRAGPFEWLDDPDHGGRFPSTVRTIPILSLGDLTLSWQVWKRSQDGKDKTATESFEKIVQAATVDQLRDSLAVLDECKEAIRALAAKLTERLGDLAPGMTQLDGAIEECRSLADLIYKRKAPAGAPEAPATTPDGESPTQSTAGTATPAASAPATREAVYRQLAEAARILEQIEPHSPIPYLIRRAVALGSLPFHEMIKSFVRDASVISEMERELAIEPPPE